MSSGPAQGEVASAGPSALMMPMRDGVKLYTELFFPAGTDGPYPAVVIRTPYMQGRKPLLPVRARGHVPIEDLNAAGYVVARQACRGTWHSEGTFRWFQNEPDDGFDCVEWLASQAWSNGRIGMSGGSYLGTTQWLAARRRPPHLTCIAPQSPGGNFFYETPYIGGALYKCHLLLWPYAVSGQGPDDFGWDPESGAPPDPDGLLAGLMAQSPNTEALDRCHDPVIAAAIKEPLLHPTYDTWWEEIMLTAADAAQIDIPVFATTGFHDGDQIGALYNWGLVEDHETSARSRRHLLIGPWRHGQMDGQAAKMGEVDFGPSASVDAQAEILRFFDVYLKDGAAGPDELPARCRLFISGKNEWLTAPAYPPPAAGDTGLYLSAQSAANSVFGDGRLTFEAPREQPPDRLPTSWTTPVPVVPIGRDCRSSLARHDVLVYTSDRLDSDLTVVGPVRAEIYLAADAPDADLIVRIEDVHPDGRSVNMTGEQGFGAFRARYRKGFDSEVLLVPGEPDLIPFLVCHMGHSFLAGHRIRVTLTATAFPYVEPNHHTGEPVATAVERRTAVETIYHDERHPSRLIMPVLPG